MALSDIVNVTITAQSRFPTRLGFGTPLVVGYTTRFLDRVKSVGSVAELEALGFVAGNPEDDKIHKAVSRVFAQNPRPKRCKVGRRAGAPTQSIRLTPTAPVEGHVTSVRIGGVLFEVTSTATATVAEITGLLTLLINPDVDAIVATGASAAAPQSLTGASLDGAIGTGAITPARNVEIVLSSSPDWDATVAVVTGKDAAGRTITENLSIPDGGNATVSGAKAFASISQLDIPAQSGVGGTFTLGVGDIFGDNANLDVTATDGTTHVDVAADVVGEWFAFDGFDSLLEVADLTAEPATTLATDLAAIELEDRDWYGLEIADGQSAAQILAGAAWVEAAANPKIYVAHSFDTDVTQDTDTDIASQLQLAAYARSKVHYQRNGAGYFPVAGWYGRILPQDPGSLTWELKTIAGVPVDASTHLTSDVTDELDAKNASYYAVIRGFNVTLNSKVAAGEWLDVVRFIDWLKDQIAVDVFDELANAPKVPFTRGGISAVGGRVRNVGRRGQRIGGLDPDQELVVNLPELADLDPADIANRILRDLTFDWRLAGAIHVVNVTGNVSVSAS